MPNKEAMIPFLDDLDPFARRCGAVNLVKNTDGYLRGYNVDADGFLLGLEAQGIRYEGAGVLVLGAGGAARSIVESALDHGAAHICVLNRTPDRAKVLCGSRPGLEYGPMTPARMTEAAKDADLIINTTSLGMEEAGSDYQDFSFLEETRAAVAEVVYRPLRTALVKEAELRGLRTVRGLDMLIYQALLTFQMITEIEIDFRNDFQFLEKILCEKLDSP